MTSIDGLDATCVRARDGIHAALDADAERAAEAVEAHVAACADCRAFRADLVAVRQALRSIPSDPMPGAALDEVWRRTSRAATAPRPRGIGDWRALAAAAALAFALLGGLRFGGAVGPAPETMSPQARTDDAELRRAAAEARFVLNLTAGALRRTERTAVHRVLAGEVGSALGRVPIEFPAERPHDGGRRPHRGNHV